MADTRAAIIGSGAGGLAAAAYLAGEGFRVEVLERADHLGGLLAPFERRGYTFHPGLHYVGMCRPGQMLHELLLGIGVDAERAFVELDPDGFDRFRFPGFEVSMPRGLDAYRDRLRAAIPGDDYGLIEVFVLARALFRWMEAHPAHRSMLAGLPILELGALLRWSRATLGELLSHFLEDPRSIAAFAGGSGDYGLPPSRASALGALSVLAHYGDGAFFPRGGSGALRDALVAAAIARGARFRTGACVDRILVRDGRVAGVRLEGGETIAADVVISDADPTVTLGRLVPQEELPPRTRRKVARSEPSLGPFVMYLGLRRDVAAHGLGRFNVWSYPDLDIDASYAPLFDGSLPERLPLFVSSASAKDDSGTLAPPGCSTVEVVTFVPRDLFDPEAGSPSRHLQRKAALEERILAEVEQRLPGLVGDVEVCEASTPVALARWTGAVGGGAYGPALTPSQWGPFRFGTRTPIDQLYLVGAGVLGGGVAAALMSGRLAAAAAVVARAGRPIQAGAFEAC